MRKHLNIWVAFVAFVFMILFATAGKMAMLYHVASRMGWLEDGIRFSPIAFMALVSIAFGTLAFALVSKKMMRFVYELRDATKRIAAGDFTVRIREKSRIREVTAILQDFNKMVEDLSSIETLKDDFVTSVSHEIKTPLAGIEGCLEILKDEHITYAERLEYIGLIETSIKRLSALTANILRLSKLDNQAILSYQSSFSLDEQIRQAILILEQKWCDKNINLNIYLSPATVTANKELLMQVWTNLIDNAIKFSPPGGDINIELTFVEGTSYVKVTDFGIGIGEDAMGHIFQKFYQGSQSRETEGNGLGLALVKRIVELTGGTISVKSRVGRGTTFLVELP